MIATCIQYAFNRSAEASTRAPAASPMKMCSRRTRLLHPEMPAAEEALRPEHQEDHQHQDAERVRVGKRPRGVRKEGREEILGLAQQDAGDDAAAHRAHAP